MCNSDVAERATYDPCASGRCRPIALVAPDVSQAADDSSMILLSVFIKGISLRSLTKPIGDVPPVHA